jgi:hypothetical protein
MSPIETNAQIISLNQKRRQKQSMIKSGEMLRAQARVIAIQR